MRQVLLSATLCIATQANAGPWMRDQGAGFLSFSVETATSGGQVGDIFGTTYFEYGLSDRVTLGFDLGASEKDLYKAVAFAKTPIVWFDGPISAAAEIGIGLTNDEVIVRPGLSLGRGFPLGGLTGWMSLDTLAHLNPESSDVDLTTDVTFGINMSDRSKLILQVQTGHQVMELDFVKFAPSYVYEHKNGQHLEIGMLAGIENAENFALKLGLWRSF